MNRTGIALIFGPWIAAAFAGIIAFALTSCAPVPSQTNSKPWVIPIEVAHGVYEYRFDDGVRCYETAQLICVVVK